MTEKNLFKDILKKSSKAVHYTVIFKVTSQLVSIFVTIILVRYLSKHDYGVYNLFYSTIAVIGLIASFGLSNTLQRYIPEYYQRGEFILANCLYKVSAFIRLSSNVAILGLVLIFWDSFAVYVKTQIVHNNIISKYGLCLRQKGS